MSQTTCIGVAPAFPPELERLIFEQAARDDKSIIPTLVLVAFRVWHWIRFMQYEIVTEPYKPGRDPAKKDYPDQISARLPRYCHYIRHLLIQEPGVAVPYLSHCSNVENLALWTRLSNVDVLSMLGVMPLRRLSISVKTLFQHTQIDLTHPLFSKITHLEVLDSILEWDDLRQIVDMPNLTHLAIYRPESRKPEHIPVAECKKLKVVILLGVRECWVEKLFPDEPRVVAMRVSQPTMDWTKGAEGDVDFWVLAEEEVAKRRAKLLARS
ncbi:hypothetical protein AX16_002147 [Volvariella volvacea WC 439]|nr:hypothetical protein AX16_002147 [Volvariella volvacea WC 439]